MSEQQSSYRQIFKATSIFGGVQVFNILVSIIKLKFVAVLLGPSGVGLFGLFNSTIEVLKISTGLGLSSSAVRDVSQAAGTGNVERVSSILKTLNRWLYLTGAIGFIITLALAPYLSLWTFGNEDYTWSFVWLSIVLFFSALSSGQMAALQGMRKISYLAKSGMIGSLIGLIISLPLFYFFSYLGIVPSIIVSAICSLVLSSIYAHKIDIVPVKQTLGESFTQGKEMVKLGIMMMLSGLMTTVAAYIIRAYISNDGGLSDVGIFQSGFSIVEGYFGLIFTAMATDYYPRLAAVNTDNVKVKDEVNKQAEIGLLIAFPIIVVALFIMPWAIELLYTQSFLKSVPYINWAILGNVFKVGSWAMGFVLFAKGKSTIFVWTALGFNTLFSLTSIFGYKLFGIEGIGIAYLFNYIIHFISLYFICNVLFDFKYQKSFWIIIFVVLLFSVIAFIVQGFDILLLKNIFAVMLISFAVYFSYKQLNKKLNLTQLLTKLFKHK